VGELRHLPQKSWLGGAKLLNNNGYINRFYVHYNTNDNLHLTFTMKYEYLHFKYRLPIISIENQVAKNVGYDDNINNFVTKKSRKIKI